MGFKPFVALNLLLVLVCFSLLLVPLPAEAGDGSLFAQADRVVEGRVERVRSFWEGDAIYTEVTLRTYRVLKGDTSHPIVLYHLGGEIDGVGLAVSDQPRFVPGEEVRVYLIRHEDGTWWVLPGGKRELAPGAIVGPQYALTGVRWCNADIPVPYLINRSGTPDVPGEEEFAAIHNAFQRWNDVRGSYIEFSYEGMTTARPNRFGEKDGLNVVGWMSKEEWGEPSSSSTLGRALYWYWTSTKCMFEFDIVVFDDWLWGVNGEGDRHDVESLMVHEVGHVVGLAHSLLRDSVMYPYLGTGEIRRTLHQDDVDGARALYPRPEPSPTLLFFLQDVEGGGYTPPSQQVSIDGAGEWSASSDHSWIHITPSSGSTPGTLTISLAETAGFAEGTYEGRVDVVGAQEGTPHPVTVRLVVARLQHVYLPLVAAER